MYVHTLMLQHVGTYEDIAIYTCHTAVALPYSTTAAPRRISTWFATYTATASTEVYYIAEEVYILLDLNNLCKLKSICHQPISIFSCT